MYLGMFVLSMITNIFLSYQLSVLVDDSHNIYGLYMKNVEILDENFGTLNYQVPTDSLYPSVQMYLRYGIESCGKCVYDAEALLEDVFGREYITKKLCIVNPRNESIFPSNYKFIKYEGLFTPMDSVYSPYFCLIDKYGKVSFILDLHPEDYDNNRTILLYLRKRLLQH